MVITASLPAEPGDDGNSSTHAGRERRLCLVGGRQRGYGAVAVPRDGRDGPGVGEGAGRVRVPVVVPSAKELAEARRAARLFLPGPALLVGRLALALLEVEAGLRPAEQLQRRCLPEAWDALSPRLLRRGGPFVPGSALRRVVCQEPSPGLAEGVAVLCREERVSFVAMRLDACDGAWKVADLSWAPRR